MNERMSENIHCPKRNLSCTREYKTYKTIEQHRTAHKKDKTKMFFLKSISFTHCMVTFRDVSAGVNEIQHAKAYTMLSELVKQWI